MQINESIENYLERILILQHKKGYARSVDIAAELNVTKASVSHAMKLLRENNYITINEDGHIFMTQSGKDIAARMYERHEIIAQMLMAIGVSKNTAYEDACKIEHDISDETFNAICEHTKKTI